MGVGVSWTLAHAMGEGFEMQIPAGVGLVKSSEPAQWAIQRMNSANDPPQWKLSTFMPAGFEAYVRILHPLADRGAEGPSWPWRLFAAREALPIAPEWLLPSNVERRGGIAPEHVGLADADHSS